MSIFLGTYKNRELRVPTLPGQLFTLNFPPFSFTDPSFAYEFLLLRTVEPTPLSIVRDHSCTAFHWLFSSDPELSKIINDRIIRPAERTLFILRSHAEPNPYLSP